MVKGVLSFEQNGAEVGRQGHGGAPVVYSSLDSRIARTRKTRSDGIYMVLIGAAKARVMSVTVERCVARGGSRPQHLRLLVLAGLVPYDQEARAQGRKPVSRFAAAFAALRRSFAPDPGASRR
jgi:hypothetical protein